MSMIQPNFVMVCVILKQLNFQYIGQNDRWMEEETTWKGIEMQMAVEASSLVESSLFVSSQLSNF